MKHLQSHHKISLISIAVIIILIGISVFSYKSIFKRDLGLIIMQDVSHLAAIFEKINKTAGIASFDFVKNPINFLNIKKDGFVGSRIGSMNLIHPAQWQGPYMDQVAHIQDEQYMVLKTKQGFFIMPDDGVTLPNGKVMGKDIIVNEDSDVEALTHDGPLSYQGHALAAKISVGNIHPQLSQILISDEGE